MTTGENLIRSIRRALTEMELANDVRHPEKPNLQLTLEGVQHVKTLADQYAEHIKRETENG